MPMWQRIQVREQRRQDPVQRRKRHGSLSLVTVNPNALDAVKIGGHSPEQGRLPDARFPDNHQRPARPIARSSDERPQSALFLSPPENRRHSLGDDKRR